MGTKRHAFLWGLLVPVAIAAAPVDGLVNQLDAIREEAGVAAYGLVLVDTQAEPLVVARGIADRATSRAFKTDDYVRVGSITKSFTGLALLAAARAGKVDLNAPIEPAAGRFENPWHPEHPVTLARLLEHTAGLGELTKTEWDHNRPVSLREALAVAPESRRLRWPPGQFSVYSNSGAGVAAFVFEQQTDMDFEAWVSSVVFLPLGMASATFEPLASVLDSLPIGYDRDGETPIPYWHQLYRPFASVNVRLGDMAPFIEMLLRRGQHAGRTLFEPAEIERVETPTTTPGAREGLRFGYGLGNYARVARGVVWRGHGGDADGYLSHYGYSPDLGRGYFLVINAFQNRTLRRMRDRVERFVSRGAQVQPIPAATIDTADLEALVGSYRESASRFGAPDGVAAVELRGAGLWLVRGEREEALVALGGSLFRRPFEPVATIAFVREGGRLFLEGPFGTYERLASNAPK